MKKLLLLCGLFLISHAAFAGPYADKLKTCSVQNSTSKKDRIITARWLMAAVLEHPDLKDLNGLNASQTKRVDKEFADLLIRILMKDCRTELLAVFEHEPAGFEKAMEAVGEVLGEAGMEEVLNSKRVEKAAERFVEHIDENKLLEMMLD